MRVMWREYFPKIDAMVYLVDAADPDRFEESKKEFKKILDTDELGNIPIVILGNKIDKKTAVRE